VWLPWTPIARRSVNYEFELRTLHSPRGVPDFEENRMAALTEDEVLSALKQCYDPEIPVNIVDLGLIYGVHFEDAPEEKQDVTVEMTLTAQGCPSHVQIGEQVKARVEQMPGVRNAIVNVVWNPPWSPERLSPDARRQLGIE
jgi:metal-sulfur cluster biosynthetic enzyme